MFEWAEVFKFITAAFGSIGIALAIIFSLSSFLGKVWANRILENEKSNLSKELSKLKNDLDIYKETFLSVRNDKLQTYRAVIDVIANMLGYIDSVRAGRTNPAEAEKTYDAFNKKRIQLYGYLGMLAPQNVMDAQDELVDYLLNVKDGKVLYEWPQIRSKGVHLINQIRKDIGIDTSPIEYKGDR